MFWIATITVETQYNKILWTRKFCLLDPWDQEFVLYQIFCYISSPQTIQNKRKLINWDQRNYVFYQISLYRVSTVQSSEFRVTYSFSI